jgi:dolichyl-phosphate-mannose-protein mannosyltransferase
LAVTGEAARRRPVVERDAPWRRALRRLDTREGLLGMFAFALVLRLAIAPQIGYYGDLQLMRRWTEELSRSGIHGFYTVEAQADYPPGYLYYWWLVGKISASPGFLLLKFLPIVCDLAFAWVAGTFAARIAPRAIARRMPVRTVVAAAVLFNPAVIADSSVYGQVDVVPAFFVIASLLLLLTGRRSVQRDVAAFALLGAAFIVKPQACFALPVLLYVLYRRYLHRRSAVELIDGALGVALIGLTALVVVVVVSLPFGLGPVKLYHLLKYSSSVYPVTSHGAFNFWGAVGSMLRNDNGAHAVTVVGIPAYYVGPLCFVAATAAAIWLSHRAIERGAESALTLTLAAALTTLFGFTFLTRMHERYMFTGLVLLAPLLFARPMRRAYVALSAIFVLNLWNSFAFDNLVWKHAGYDVHTLKLEPFFGWILGGQEFDTWQKRLLSALVTLIVVVLIWRGFAYCRADPVKRSAPSRAYGEPERQVGVDVA